jgi:hypothetical protein
MGLLKKIGRGIAKAGRGLAAVGTGGLSELAIHTVKSNQKNAPDKAARLARESVMRADMDKARSALGDPNRQDAFVGNQGLVNGQLRSDLQMGNNPIWAQMLEGNLGRQGFEENQMLSRTGQQMAGAQAQAQSQLAMRGGLQGGARNRMAMQGARDQMLGMQDVRAQGVGQRFGIHSQDQENRAKAMTGDVDRLSGMLGGESTAMNLYNQNKYSNQTDAYGRLMQGTGADMEASKPGLWGRMMGK